MHRFRNKQIQNQKCAGTGNGADNPLPKAGEGIAGIGIFRQKGSAGEAHPHKPFHAKKLPCRQNQAYAKRHAQLPQADGGGQIKLQHHMAEPDGFVLMAMLRKQNGTTEQISGQSQKTAANQSLSDDRIAREIDICKTVQSAVSHFGPLGGDI